MTRQQILLCFGAIFLGLCTAAHAVCISIPDAPSKPLPKMLNAELKSALYRGGFKSHTLLTTFKRKGGDSWIARLRGPVVTVGQQDISISRVTCSYSKTWDCDEQVDRFLVRGSSHIRLGLGENGLISAEEAEHVLRHLASVNVDLNEHRAYGILKKGNWIDAVKLIFKREGEVLTAMSHGGGCGPYIRFRQQQTGAEGLKFQYVGAEWIP